MDEGELGRYRLIRRLGAGGMGEVFLARLDREEGFSKQLVIKRILPELSGDARFREMFAAEARIAASLNHPNIIQVTDFGRVQTNCYLAMEHVDGTNLASLIDSAHQRLLRIPLDFAFGVTLACLRALGYAHRCPAPVVHGDVSPSNVLIGREGEVKLADFGLARLSGSCPASYKTEIRGKLSYMAPEVAFGRRPEAPSDMFGVGAILFELIAGVPPLPPVSQLQVAIEQARQCLIPPVAELVPEIHSAIANVIDRALAPCATDRFENAASMEEALLRIANTLGLDPGPRAISSFIRAVLGSAGTSGEGEIPRTLVAARPRSKIGGVRAALIPLLAGIAALGIAAATWYFLYSSSVEEGGASTVAVTPVAGEPDADGGAVDLADADGQDRQDTIQDSGLSSDTAGGGSGSDPSPRKHVAATRLEDAGTRIRPLAAFVPAPFPDGGMLPSAGDPGGLALEHPSDQPPETSDPVAIRQGFVLRTNRPATCSIDGQPERACPLTIELGIKGVHLITVKEGESLTLVLRFEEEGNSDRVRLACRSLPFAILSVDGQPKGVTPLGHISLSRELHVIALAIPEHPPLELSLDIQ